MDTHRPSVDERQIVRRNYNRLSRWYDILSGGSEKRISEIGIKALAPTHDEQVLEIGAGTGSTLPILARAVQPNGIIYGLDLSEGMLSVAKAKLTKAGMLQNISLIQGDATALPYCDDCFDKLFLSFSLELFTNADMISVLTETKRVLKPNGKCCVVAMAEGNKSNLITRLYRWSHETFPRVIDCRPIRTAEVLCHAGYHLLSTVDRSIWGLPVSIVLAQKPSFN